MLNYEPLGEIFSYRDETWVALNPLILSAGQGLELDLEPKRGRGEKSTQEFETLKLAPAPSFLPQPSQAAGPWGGCGKGPPHPATPPWRGIHTGDVGPAGDPEYH